VSRLVEPAAGPAALLRTDPRSRAVSLAEFSSADAIDGLPNSDQQQRGPAVGPAVEYGPGPRSPKPPKGDRGRRTAEDPMTLWHPGEGR
jgi:hypothetical protein